jgi:hypothetical protein
MMTNSRWSGHHWIDYGARYDCLPNAAPDDRQIGVERIYSVPEGGPGRDFLIPNKYVVSPRAPKTSPMPMTRLTTVDAIRARCATVRARVPDSGPSQVFNKIAQYTVSGIA